MKNQTKQSIKIRFRNDGSIKSKVTNPEGKEIATIVCMNGSFNAIERKIDNKGKSCEVVHSAWGSDFYHEDKKLEKFPAKAKVDKKYCDKKLEEKQNIRKLIGDIINNNQANGRGGR